MAAEPVRNHSAEPPPRPGRGPKPALVSVREDLPRLDRLIHEKLRLGIISALAATPSLTFRELKDLLETSDGNLSVHARKLGGRRLRRFAKSHSRTACQRPSTSSRAKAAPRLNSI